MMRRVGILGLDRDLQTSLGYTPHVTSRRQLVDLVWVSGCLPLVLPPKIDAVDALLDSVDGLLIPGGGDIDPGLYGRPAHPEQDWVDEVRDRIEVALVRAAIDRDTPVLGICRGIQAINVALGGTLVQHLPDCTDLPHYVSPGWQNPCHQVAIVREGTHEPFAHAPALAVNSLHHQALDRVADGLEVLAVASDGVVEAVELAGRRFVLGVQWHPELMDDPAQAEIFRAFARSMGAR